MGAVDWTTVEQAIQAWIVAGSGLTGDHVVWDQQNKARPTPPFVTLAFISDLPIGMDGVTSIAVPLVASIQPTAISTSTDTFTKVAHGFGSGDGPFQATTTFLLPDGVAASTNYWLVVTGPDTLQLAPTFLDAVATSPTIVDITSSGAGQMTLSTTAESETRGKEVQQTVRGNSRATLSIQVFVPDGVSVGPTSARAILKNIQAAVSLPSVRFNLNEAFVGVGAFGSARYFSQVINTTVLEPRAQIDVELFLPSELVEYETYIARAKVTPTIDDEIQPTLTFDTA